MVLQCRSCGQSMKNRLVENHIKWKCVDAKMWCPRCCEKFPGNEYAQHSSCVEVTKVKGENRTEALRKLVLESVNKERLKNMKKAQLRVLAKKVDIPTTTTNISKYIDRKVKFANNDTALKGLAKEIFLEAAEKLPVVGDDRKIDNWYFECRKMIVRTLKSTETDAQHKKELLRLLRTVSQPKIWGNFQKFIKKDRFSSPEVKDLAMQVYLEAKLKFPRKPAKLEVANQWQELVTKTLESIEANEKDKEALSAILRDRNLPKDQDEFTKFVHHPNRFHSSQLRELAQRVYAEALASMPKKKIKKKKAVIKKRSVPSGRTKKRKPTGEKIANGIAVKAKFKNTGRSGAPKQERRNNRSNKNITPKKKGIGNKNASGAKHSGYKYLPQRNEPRNQNLGNRNPKKSGNSNEKKGQITEPQAKKKRRHIFFP